MNELWAFLMGVAIGWYAWQRERGLRKASDVMRKHAENEANYWRNFNGKHENE